MGVSFVYLWDISCEFMCVLRPSNPKIFILKKELSKERNEERIKKEKVKEF